MATKKILLDGVIDYLEIALINNNNQIENSICIPLNKNLITLIHQTFVQIANNHIIETILFINGPGNFTSLKLSTVFVNTYLFLFSHTKLKQLYSTQWHQTKINETVCIDAKNQQYYLQNNNLKTPILLSQKDLANNFKPPFYFYTYNQKKSLNQRWIYNQNQFVSCNQIIPYYLKKPV